MDSPDALCYPWGGLTLAVHHLIRNSCHKSSEAKQLSCPKRLNGFIHVSRGKLLFTEYECCSNLDCGREVDHRRRIYHPFSQMLPRRQLGQVQKSLCTCHDLRHLQLLFALQTRTSGFELAHPSVFSPRFWSWYSGKLGGYLDDDKHVWGGKTCLASSHLASGKWEGRNNGDLHCGQV